MKTRRSSNLLALGSAAVLTVYTAGYARTKPAADRMAAASNERRPAPPRDDAAAAQKPDTSIVISPTALPSPVVATSNANDSALVTKAADKIAKPAAATLPRVAKTAQPETEHAAAPSVVESPVSTTSVASTSSVSSTPSPTSSTASTPVPATAPVQSAPPAVAATATATAPATASETPAAPVKPVWRDGTYVGRGTSRHGDIEAMVEIKDGKITGAVISQCLTRYSCSWVSHLLPQVVSRQSADVDYVSGATQSANALYYAVLQALTQAK